MIQFGTGRQSPLGSLPTYNSFPVILEIINRRQSPLGSLPTRFWFYHFDEQKEEVAIPLWVVFRRASWGSRDSNIVVAIPLWVVFRPLEN